LEYVIRDRARDYHNGINVAQTEAEVEHSVESNLFVPRIDLEGSGNEWGDNSMASHPCDSPLYQATKRRMREQCQPQAEAADVMSVSSDESVELTAAWWQDASSSAAAEETIRNNPETIATINDVQPRPRKKKQRYGVCVCCGGALKPCLLSCSSEFGRSGPFLRCRDCFYPGDRAPTAAELATFPKTCFPRHQTEPKEERPTQWGRCFKCQHALQVIPPRGPLGGFPRLGCSNWSAKGGSCSGFVRHMTADELAKLPDKLLVSAKSRI
jgi:hypothetical protein